MGNKTSHLLSATPPSVKMPQLLCIANASRRKNRGKKKRGELVWHILFTSNRHLHLSSSVHVDSPGRVWEARVSAVLLLMVLLLLGLMLLGLVVVILILMLLLLLLIVRRRLLLLLLVLLMLLLLLLLLAVLVVATTRMLHHRIESRVHASDSSSCATRGRAMRGEVFALRI
jgi:membrane protein implicated in regulation of membrane protease activity